MKRVVIGKNTVDIYETIEEMPITRYMEYNKYLLIDSGIGSTPETINRNIDKVANYINRGDKENGLKQLMLLKQNLYFVKNGQSPQLMAFACLIHAIDEKLVTDLSVEGLQRIIEKFGNKLTVKLVQKIIEDIKKKYRNRNGSIFSEYDG